MIDHPLAGLLVLGLLIAAPLLLRRLRAATPEGVRIVGRTALHKNAVVAVVAVGERRLLVGAGERGVQLLTELDGEATDPTAPHSSPVIDRTDVVDASTPLGDRTDAALEALLAPVGPNDTTTGPRIGLVDRLRVMTVRTPQTGRPIRVPFRH